MDAERPYLSVVIPVYNEADCIEANLRAVCAYLRTQPYTWEVIVVDDGSLDQTAQIVEGLCAGEPGLRLLRNDHRGKAYAVRTGVLSSRGEFVLFADADLATPIEEVGKLLAALQAGADVAIGSREAYGALRLNEPPLRHLMGRAFNLLVRLLILGQHKDTQCGFKAFSRRAADDIFQSVRLYGPNAAVLSRPAVTGFDVELLYLAHRKGYRVAEVPVQWRYGPGSKVNPLHDSWRNLKDVLRVRYYALRGLYR
jgi:dolichyl-phosphate beta-glucosyltransferase